MEDAFPGEFLFLNHDNAWPGFQHVGIEIRADGTVQLSALPRLDSPFPGAETLPNPVAPAGLVFDSNGSMYYTAGDLLMTLADCAEGTAPMPCVSQHTQDSGHLGGPAGLAWNPTRHSLLLADRVNHRVLILSLPGGEIREAWGQAGMPNALPWRLESPASVTVDSRGFVYVTGAGSRPLQKFDPRGRPVERFWSNAAREVNWAQPVCVVVAPAAEAQVSGEIYILDAGLRAVLVLDRYGRFLDRFGEDALQEPIALAVDHEAVYVGDNGLRQVLQFRRQPGYPLSGSAAGYSGPCAALALDPDGGLWLHPGGSNRPVRFSPREAFAQQGVLWGGPFGSADRPIVWRGLKALTAPLGAGTHLQMFVAHGLAPADAPPAPLPQDPAPFGDPAWIPLPPDTEEAYNPVGKAPFLWVGLHLTGNGFATPEIQQVRLSFNHETYRKFLPATYSSTPTQAGFLDRLLSLFESFNADVEGEIASLGRWVDPQAIPAESLRWLAGWVGLNLDSRWTEQQQRQAIASAIASYKYRGTPAGLRLALRFFTGVEARVVEPAQYADWWSLAPSDEACGEVSAAALGFIRLAPFEDDGIVLGSSAVLDHSIISGSEDFGAVLFDSTAHRFAVLVYASQVSGSDRLARVQEIIEQEKPAHTEAHLCIIQPMMRVGFQAQLGIDTVIAGPRSAPACLNGDPMPGSGLALGGDPAGSLGANSQVGQTTRLGYSSQTSR